MAKPSVYVITGASRGLGLELTKQVRVEHVLMILEDFSLLLILRIKGTCTKSSRTFRRCWSHEHALRLLQLLERGDEVVAAARDPASSSGLQSLQKEHTKQLSFVTLDTSDAASIQVAQNFCVYVAAFESISMSLFVRSVVSPFDTAWY